jgi:DNA polymerase I
MTAEVDRPSTPVPTLLLIDGHAYAYRAFHAIRKLNGPDGRPTNAIFGFVKMLGRMRAAIRPERLAVVWDGGLSAARLEILPAYKAQRPAMPDDLADQIGAIGLYLKAAGLVALEREGVEADDYIASLARAGVFAGCRVVIASPDKDFFQLVGERVGILNAADKSGAIWGVEQVREKTGVEPGQIVDWLSLIGDAVDNIPGVPGIGPKTATELLKRFGTAEALFSGLDNVTSERLRRALAGAADAVERNRKMIGLDMGVPDLPAIDDLKCGVPDQAELLKLFQGWGFRSLAAEVEAARHGQRDLFAPVN